MASPIDPAVKAEAIRLVSEGLSQSAAARTLGLPQTTISTWCRKADGRERPGLYVGWAGGGLPRPDLPEGIILRPMELSRSMEAWKARVRSSSVDDVLERTVRSNWDADGTRRTA